MRDDRRTGATGFVACAAVALLTLTTGCDQLSGKAGGSEESAAVAAPAPAPVAAAPNSGVIRYTGMESEIPGQLVVRSTVRARKAADESSDVVATLVPGTTVQRISTYAAGTYTLVSWAGPAGDQQEGWVQTSAALRGTTVTFFDAGTPFDAGLGFAGLGGGTTPVPTQGTVAPPPTATVPPPPTATQPPPPPPPPTATQTATAPRPPKAPPTATSKGGVKPPSLGN